MDFHQVYDGTIRIDVDFASTRAASPQLDTETKAQFRARVAKELFDKGEVFTAYQVLYNAKKPEDFIVQDKLVGYYNGIENTAAVVQARFEYMLSVQNIVDEQNAALQKERMRAWALREGWRRFLRIITFRWR